MNRRGHERLRMEGVVVEVVGGGGAPGCRYSACLSKHSETLTGSAVFVVCPLTATNSRNPD